MESACDLGVHLVTTMTPERFDEGLNDVSRCFQKQRLSNARPDKISIKNKKLNIQSIRNVGCVIVISRIFIEMLLNY